MTSLKTLHPDGTSPTTPEPFTARVAVVAHRRKTLGGGLGELRSRLHDAGITDPAWCEVPKSKKAPKQARAAVKAGADLLLVWGGDGMVQRCVDTLADLGDAAANVRIGIIPAGTANLLATNLGIPHDLAGALDIALSGRTRRIDLGVVNGEHFGVMAGAGFDARMIAAAGQEAKTRLGSLAYVRTGVSAIRSEPEPVHVLVDGVTFHEGPASCVLVGNVGRATGGLLVFEHAEPDDGLLDVGVVTADGAVQWLRVLARVALHRGAGSPLVRTSQGRTIDVRFEQPTIYELDGGTRSATGRLRFEVKPAAVPICVPDGATARSSRRIGSER